MTRRSSYSTLILQGGVEQNIFNWCTFPSCVLIYWKFWKPLHFCKAYLSVFFGISNYVYFYHIFGLVNCRNIQLQKASNWQFRIARVARHGICQKKFTPLDFQAKNFTPPIPPNFNSFSKKKHKKWVKMEKFTPLAKILHCRRHWRDGQIPPLKTSASPIKEKGLKASSLKEYHYPTLKPQRPWQRWMPAAV